MSRASVITRISHRCSQFTALGLWVPAAFALVGVGLIANWLWTAPSLALSARLPGMDNAPKGTAQVAEKRPVAGEPVRSDGVPSKVAAAWPCFRGIDRDAINKEDVHLARQWPAAGPKRLWQAALGEGYAAAAIAGGCVYVLDYDEKTSADTLRCLSLDDGREIWRNGYPVVLTANHGRSRTIPAVVGNHVVSFGPKCQVAGWDAETGKSLWLIDLVLDHGASIPPWYAGQCPLIDAQTDRLIIGCGGKSLVMALDYRTGKILWESPNPRNWAMTHVSVLPIEFAGRRMYVYCGKGGVAGIDAQTGELLWDTTDWQISMATCPTPVVVGDGKLFFCGGYNSGSLMLQLKEEQGHFTSQTLFRLTPRQFGSEQQTPVCWQGHLYGVRQKDQQLVCLDLGGKEQWNSGGDKFGSGPYMLADGLILAMNDDGVLTIAEATPQAYRRLAKAPVFEDGSSSWGPMALAAGRLVVRDFNRIMCLDIAEQK